VVYIPALALLGMQMKMGVAFSLATMTVGNGIFGFLKWNSKDNADADVGRTSSGRRETNTNNLLWSTFPLTVIPCWIGSAIGIFFVPPMNDASLKIFFAIFCICLATFVLYAADQGGNLLCQSLLAL
jgi:uncharacterized membrane protein YfcA